MFYVFNIKSDFKRKQIMLAFSSSLKIPVKVFQSKKQLYVLVMKTSAASTNFY